MVSMTRRQLLTTGAIVGAVAVVGGGGAALIDAGVLPGKVRMGKLLGACNVSAPVPETPPGKVLRDSFSSRYRARKVNRLTILPPGHSEIGELPLVVGLHGYGADIESLVELHLPEFLADAVDNRGVPAFAVVAADGGDGYWHPHPGDDPMGMVLHELAPKSGSYGLWGFSMGGYGALLIATESGGRCAAAVGSSPAVFHSYSDARSINPGAYVNQADWDKYCLQNRVESLRGQQLWIDCGSNDGFTGEVEHLRRQLTSVNGEISKGCHDDRYWESRLPKQLAFLGDKLT